MSIRNTNETTERTCKEEFYNDDKWFSRRNNRCFTRLDWLNKQIAVLVFPANTCYLLCMDLLGNPVLLLLNWSGEASNYSSSPCNTKVPFPYRSFQALESLCIHHNFSLLPRWSLEGFGEESRHYQQHQATFYLQEHCLQMELNCLFSTHECIA